ncbi:heparinase II/III family protein [Roseococcus sp. SDR]|uniref:heparinase II/III family protein n=1 Tax=Roseococcus sp. SDR TaxID=2835532 RepID=UPI001BCBDB41|nr:heparinase II/III family protein [Roseococcus sp. SDR]MBS7792824.1 heparinase II/III family protein [Roseococcus sp. SDR]MBV1848138.1 heparinase II/III family protein [Roseococcus sp. SDR]
MADVFRNVRGLFTRLKPMRVPDAPARSFRDLWPGDAARGARLLRGEFEVLGSVRLLNDWTPAAGPVLWRQAAHGFAWLRDLRMLGTDAARVMARDLTEDWLARGAAEAMAQAPEVAAARISAWLGHWDFLAATAEDGFRKQLLQRLALDGRALSASLPAEAAHRGGLVALKGSIAAAVALEEEAWMTRALRFLGPELERQFHPDGGHVERSPAVQLLALQDLIEIRNLLNGVGIASPPQLSLALERAGQALRLFRHGDMSLALFNSTREEAPALVDVVLAQGLAKGRAPMLLEETGFHRMAAGRTLVIADCGAPPPGRPADPASGLPRGADRASHAGTLSFEMSVGRDRLIVNCGAAPAADAAWRDALRGTAAHSTLTLADTNSAELREEGLGRRPERVEIERQEANGAQWLDISHDGYRRTHGVVHRRRLYLSESGDDLRGEDVLEPFPGPATAWAIRFHLHPAVTAVLQEEEGGVLMRLSGGQGWRFRARGARVELEESVYLAAEPRRSSQIVLTSDGEAETVQWAISRVVPGGEN